MDRLTPDLTMDILSRLPIRSLLRARCVCKSWHTLTYDPIFSTLQLNRLSINNNDAIVLTYPNNLFGQQQLYFSEQPNLSEENFSLFTRKIDLSFITEKEKQHLFVVGTCNGLLCLAILRGGRSYSPTSIHILNPITGERQQLPDFGITCGKDPISVIYGFGFDDSENVFKVVVFLTHVKPSSNHMDVVNEMQICTIGEVSSNRWRRQLDNLPNVLFYSIQKILNAFVGGFLHLIATTNGSRDGSDDRIIVVSFHLGSEDFEVIQTPESIALKQYYEFSEFFALGVIDNCLSFVDAANAGFVEIWIRKIKNGIFSWTKTFSIHGENIAPKPFGSCKLVVLNYGKDGELLLQLYERLVSYNAKSNTSKIFEIGDHDYDGIYDAETFPLVGSLNTIKSQA